MVTAYYLDEGTDDDEHKAVARLMNADAKPHKLKNSATGQDEQVTAHATFRLTRQAGKGVEVERQRTFPIQLPAGLPLEPGMYQWQLEIDGVQMTAQSFQVA